jgi:hypothetical protein
MADDNRPAVPQSRAETGRLILIAMRVATEDPGQVALAGVSAVSTLSRQDGLKSVTHVTSDPVSKFRARLYRPETEFS